MFPLRLRLSPSLSVAGAAEVTTKEALDIRHRPSQNTANRPSEDAYPALKMSGPQHMTPIQPLQPARKQKVSPDQCKHPQVQIVSRDEDSEYVKCKECGDVFESSEFKDMAIEERKDLDQA